MANTIQLSQYKTWVRNKLDDPSYDDATLTQFAGDVNAEVCNLVPWSFMEKTFRGTIDTSTNTFVQPTDLQQMISIQVTSPTNKIIDVDYMAYTEFVQRYPAPATLTAAPPSIYSTFAGYIVFGPSYPDQTYTLTEQYIKYPTRPASDSSTLDVPDDFSEVVVLGMYARALEAADQPDYAIAQYNKFNAQIQLMKNRYSLRQIGSPMIIPNHRTLLRGR